MLTVELKELIENIKTPYGDRPLRIMETREDVIDITDKKYEFSLASVSRKFVGCFNVLGDRTSIILREGLSEGNMRELANIIMDYSFTELQYREPSEPMPDEEEKSNHVKELEAENTELTMLNRKLEQEMKELKVQIAKVKNLLA